MASGGAVLRNVHSRGVSNLALLPPKALVALPGPKSLPRVGWRWVPRAGSLMSTYDSSLQVEREEGRTCWGANFKCKKLIISHTDVQVVQVVGVELGGLRGSLRSH